MPVSTRAAVAKGQTSARATKSGKENADPSKAASGGKAKASKRASTKTGEPEADENAATSEEILARVQRIGVQALPGIPLQELKAGLRKLNTSDVIRDAGTKGEKPARAAAESDELNDLAFLGIAGTTPGGRRWRTRTRSMGAAAADAESSAEGRELAPLAPLADAVDVA
jgi:hypothetical protein